MHLKAVMLLWLAAGARCHLHQKAPCKDRHEIGCRCRCGGGIGQCISGSRLGAADIGRWASLLFFWLASCNVVGEDNRSLDKHPSRGGGGGWDGEGKRGWGCAGVSGVVCGKGRSAAAVKVWPVCTPPVTRCFAHFRARTPSFRRMFNADAASIGGQPASLTGREVDW